MTKFQLVIFGLFVCFIIAGVFAFATFKGGNTSESIPAVTIWGTFPKTVFDNYLSKINLTRDNPLSVTYVQISPTNFSSQFIAALARRQGPDAILISADMLLPHLDKITVLPYSVMSERIFKESFIQEGEIYLSRNGIRAIPFAVDPLVMYWNRDIFSTSGLATYPKTWNELSNLNSRLTVVDQNGNISQSTMALGDFTNVLNAREILASMFLQTGNPIVIESDTGAQSTLRNDPNVSSVLDFFSGVVNPNNKNYSWNRAMSDSKTVFLSGKLATYFGFASELFDIRNKNANLNFDVAALPQMAGGMKTVYAKMYGMAILQSSAKQNAAYQVISILTAEQNMKMLSELLYLPSVRRDILSRGSTDPYISVFGEQALVSRTWNDADPVASEKIFADMVNTITSGGKAVFDAINDGSDKYDALLRQSMM